MLPRSVQYRKDSWLFMAAMNQQFKITKLAKDLGLKSKELVEILSQNGIEAKTTQKALEPAEFDVLFETLTSANQISNIGDYLDGKTHIPSKLKKEEAVAVQEEKPAKAAEEQAVAAPAAQKPEEAAPAKKPAKAVEEKPAKEEKPAAQKPAKSEKKPAEATEKRVKETEILFDKGMSLLNK